MNSSPRRTLRPGTVCGWVLPMAAVMSLSCGDAGAGAGLLTADVPLHLEDHRDVTTIIGSEPPADALEPLVWDFRDPQPAWQPWKLSEDVRGWPDVRQQDDVLRIAISGRDELPQGRRNRFRALAYVPLPDLRRADWWQLRVEARAEGQMGYFGMRYNRVRRTDPESELVWLVRRRGDFAGLMLDEWQTYTLPVGGNDPDSADHEDPWTDLVIETGTSWNEPVTGHLDLGSVTLVPRSARYPERAGFIEESRGRELRRTLYAHAQGRVEFTVRVPPQGRFDVGLGVVQDRPITFRVTAAVDGDAQTLLQATFADPVAWSQQSADLSAFAGQIVTLGLEAESDRDGDVALWSAPTISSGSASESPNIILYVIDAAGADLMSVYGYNRRTTPNIERIAAEGAVFEYAYSNSSWTKPSTASFLTSLHHSVLGGFSGFTDKIPAAAIPIAERLHEVGYQTALFSANPNAGVTSDLQRGTDTLNGEVSWEQLPTSSAVLQSRFREWRNAYPGQPYWAHFQTTDVHEPQRPVAPFAGMYIDPGRQAGFWESLEAVFDGSRQDQETVSGFYRRRFEEMGLDRVQIYAAQRDLYDESMAHQDWQLGRFVEELKRSGEWNNTILVITSDHGHPAGIFSRFGREMFEPPPPDNEGAFFDSYRTRIPFIVVWPGRIEPGIRISERVSLIDLVPTLLDLAGLPAAEVAQGQSLAPLLLGDPGWKPRPVIFDQFQFDSVTGQLVGQIEILDGRWGASLEIWPDVPEGSPEPRPNGQQRAAREHDPTMPRLLLYDVWADPFARANVNELHPELVAHYTEVLEEYWEAHKLLASQFVPGEQGALDAAQLETLRALGYIQ